MSKSEPMFVYRSVTRSTLRSATGIYRPHFTSASGTPNLTSHDACITRAPVSVCNSSQYLKPETHEKMGDDLLSHGVYPAVPSALAGLTSLFGMGRGVSPPLSSPLLKSGKYSVVKGACPLKTAQREP